jgi:hypothetical protein
LRQERDRESRWRVDRRRRPPPPIGPRELFSGPNFGPFNSTSMKRFFALVKVVP